MNILSLGAGVQSTTLLLMACHGEFDIKPDYAIFADTGWEPRSVYQHLDWLQSVSTIPICIVSKGNIKKDCLDSIRSKARFASMPFYTTPLQDKSKTGSLRRQCTNEYKIKCIEKKIKELLGICRFPSRSKSPIATIWLGISLDEIQRIKPNRKKCLKNIHPLIDRRMSRWDCINWLKDHNYPIPPKSACLGCPYHDDKYWLDMKRNRPEEWAEVVEFDKNIRRLPNVKHNCYVHRSLKPLDEVDLNENQEEFGFLNECEGMCGV